MKFLWMVLNQLFFVCFSNCLPYNGASDCRFYVNNERGKWKNAVRNARAQQFYDAARATDAAKKFKRSLYEKRVAR